MVEGGYRTGGLVGFVTAGTISKCSASGSVISGNDHIGGLIGGCGMNSTTIISDSYARGNVTGRDRIGGLAGNTSTQVTISRCYATGLVKDNGERDNPAIGGLCGNSDGGDGGIVASFWDVQTTAQIESSGGGTGLGTADMKKSASYSGWDFNNVWTINENSSYPTLR